MSDSQCTLHMVGCFIATLVNIFSDVKHALYKSSERASVRVMRFYSGWNSRADVQINQRGKAAFDALNYSLPSRVAIDIHKTFTQRRQCPLTSITTLCQLALYIHITHEYLHRIQGFHGQTFRRQWLMLSWWNVRKAPIESISFLHPLSRRAV